MEHREEFLEVVDAHMRDLPTARKDELALNAWISRTEFLVDQFKREMKEQMAKEGGTFGLRLQSLVHQLVIHPPQPESKIKAVLAPGVKVLGYTVSEVTDFGAVIDIRFKTGVSI